MKCPICKKNVEWAGNPYRPFCSERCQMIDLGNWASGKYGLPIEKTTMPEEDEEKIDKE
ncbi:MAG: DNA gyrase inhibitor YacG [Acidobacteria bacterium]|nr:MAG: DNA gyrase inhibitor YacG [Acidobacteriota bacterium]